MDNTSPLVSALVPVYGVEKYIEKCLHSLFSQDYENIEFIFVDDCSPDKSVLVIEQVLEQYPHCKGKTRIIHHEHNRGLAAARNTALDASQGDYLLLVDSDDWLAADNVVSRLVAKSMSEDIDLLSFDFLNVYQDGQRHQRKKVPTNREKYIKYIIESRTTPSIVTCFYRAKLFKETGVRNVEGIDRGEDVSVQARIAYYAQKIGYIPEPLYCYNRCNENSYVNSYTGPSKGTPALDVVETMYRTKPDYKTFKPSFDAARWVAIGRDYVNWAKYSGDVALYKNLWPIPSFRYLFCSRLMLRYKVVLLLNQMHLRRLFLSLVQKMMY